MRIDYVVDGPALFFLTALAGAMLGLVCSYIPYVSFLFVLSITFFTLGFAFKGTIASRYFGTAYLIWFELLLLLCPMWVVWGIAIWSRM